MKHLRATPVYPGEVSSPRSLSFYVGNPPRQMQIFSGIARPNWDSQLKLDYEDVLVHFAVPAPDGIVPDDWEYTATTSLAHIDADGDSDFTFLADECSVRKDEGTGELQLYVKIGVLGEPAHLVCFSYHVEVLSRIPVQGAVFGTIRWNKIYGLPSPAVLEGGNMFKVGQAIYDPGRCLWSWDDQFTIETSEKPQLAGDMWIVPYSITELPLEKPLNIKPDLLPGTLEGPPLRYGAGPGFAPLSYPITLTPSEPSAVGLDFEMIFAPRPG